MSTDPLYLLGLIVPSDPLDPVDLLDLIDPFKCDAEKLWKLPPEKFGITQDQLYAIRLERELERKSVKRAIKKGLFWRKGMSLSKLQPHIRKIVESGNV